MQTNATTLSVGVWNIERFGYDELAGHHRLGDAVDWLVAQGPLPHVLALPEARGGLREGQHAIQELLVNPLSRALPGQRRYEARFSSQLLPGRRNHLHLLAVDPSVAEPTGFYDPFGPESSYRSDGFVKAKIAGRKTWLVCEHWSGGEDRGEFWKAAQRVARYTKKPTLAMGDLNATSSWEGEASAGLDWFEYCQKRGELEKLLEKGWFNPLTGRWELDTRQLDWLRLCGWADAGEDAGDPTPTTHETGSGLRIDRILRSPALPAEVLDYRVELPPRELSDHAYVRCTYRLLEPASTNATRRTPADRA